MLFCVHSSCVDILLHPVDREHDLMLILLEAGRENIQFADWQLKKVLPYSSQMFGAGKTTLGENVLVLLNRDLERYNAGKSPQGVVARLLANGWTLEEVQSYADALPV